MSLSRNRRTSFNSLSIFFSHSLSLSVSLSTSLLSLSMSLTHTKNSSGEYQKENKKGRNPSICDVDTLTTMNFKVKKKQRLIEK